MTAREYLNQTFILNRTIEAKKEILKTLNDNISLTCDALLLKSMKAEKEKIELELNKELQTKMKVFAIIDKVEDATLRTLLQYKYICGMSAEEIAEKLNYSPRHVIRMHTKAVDVIEKFYKIA